MYHPTHFSARKPLCLALIGGSVSAFWCFRTPLFVFLSALRDQQAISAFVRQFGLVGPAVLFALLVAQVFLAVLPGQALMLASGYVYGFGLGSLLTTTSTILGGQLAFWLARRGGRNVVNRLAPSGLIERWDHLADRQGSMFFLFTFMLPIFPSDLMCYIAGLGKVSPRSFFIANLLGRLPCPIILSLVGAHGLHLPILLWLAFAAGYILLFAVWLFYSRTNHGAEYPGANCYAIIRGLARCYLALFRLRSKVEGETVLPPGPKILAANHPNATDAFFLPCVLPERLYILIQGNLFNIPVIGQLLSGAGQIPVQVKRRDLAFEEACELLRQGRTILIFPEGILNPARSSIQAGTGAVRISLATGAPIIPIGIHVADRDALSFGYRSANGVHTGRWQVRGCCSFHFGEAWYPSGEVVPEGGLSTARYLTAVLMEKIYSLAQAARTGNDDPAIIDNHMKGEKSDTPSTDVCT